MLFLRFSKVRNNSRFLPKMKSGLQHFFSWTHIGHFAREYYNNCIRQR